MIIPDTVETFPACPTYGFTADPFILVKIIEREGGFERVDRRWAHPRRRYTGIPIGDKPQRDIEQILYFWLAIGGCSEYFRFKDWTDYKSCLLDDQISPLDQPIQDNGDSDIGSAFQLVKVYTFGSRSYTRTIYRPKGSTIRIANQDGEEQDPSTWVLDESTGIVTPASGFDGVPTTWGGEFDVLCRFDGPFIPEVSNKNIQRADVSLVEKREVPKQSS